MAELRPPSQQIQRHNPRWCTAQRHVTEIRISKSENTLRLGLAQSNSIRPQSLRVKRRVSTYR